MVKFGWPGFVVEYFHNLLLWEACKSDCEGLHLQEYLTYYIIIFPKRLSWCGRSCHAGSGGARNSCIGFLPQAFQFQFGYFGGCGPLVLNVRQVDLEALLALLGAQLDGYTKRLTRVSQRCGCLVLWGYFYVVRFKSGATRSCKR